MFGSWKPVSAWSMALLVAADSQVMRVTVVLPSDCFPDEPPQAAVASSPPAVSNAPARRIHRFIMAS